MSDDNALVPAENLPTTEGDFPVDADYRGFLQADGSEIEWTHDSHPTAAAAVAKMFDNIEEHEHGNLIGTFEGLPKAARETIRDFLDIPGRGFAPAADENDLADFAQTAAGQVLLPEWRGRAAQNFGRASFRLSLMLSKLGSDERTKTENWYRKLSPSQKTAIVRMLAE